MMLPARALAGQDLSHTAGLQPAPSQLIAGAPSEQCETAVASAEYAGRLPPRLLAAISLTESGRVDPDSGSFRAWPWTINAEGKGRFYATERAAITAVAALQARGVQSIDVGCMQVNLMYHPRAFASLAEAFDPRSNALYAARFLNALYEVGRAWPRAIAAYHSDTRSLGDAYRILVVAHWRSPKLLDAERDSGAYRDFLPGNRAYGSFTPTGQVYGAFASSR